MTKGHRKENQKQEDYVPFTKVDGVEQCTDDCKGCIDSLGMSADNAAACKSSNMSEGWWQCVDCGAHAVKKEKIKHYETCVLGKTLFRLK